MDVGEQCCAWAPCGSKALVPVEPHTGVLTTSWLDSVGQHCQAQWFYVVLCICYDFAMVLSYFVFHTDIQYCIMTLMGLERER